MGKALTRLGALALLVAGLILMRGPGESDVAAQEKKGDLPPDLARISGRAHVLISVRPADIWESELGKGIRGKMGKDLTFLTTQMEQALGLEPAAIERVTFVMPMVAQGVEPVIYVAANKAPDRKKLLAQLVPGGEVKKHADQEYFTNDRRAAVMLDDKHYLFGFAADVQTVLDNAKAKPEGSLLPALRLAAGKHAAVVAGNPAAIGENIPVAPEAEAFKPLLKSTLATVTVDVADKAKGQLRLTFPGAADANEGAKVLEMSRQMLLGAVGGLVKQMEKDESAAGVVGLLKNLESGVKAAKLTQSGAAVAANVEVNAEKAAGVAAAEALLRVRQAASRMQSVNNLKQLALAMHNYHDANRTFPPAAIYDKDGKALLSWRVLLLPFLEQDMLFKEFRLNEAWDSPHNKKLLEKMPKVYALPGGKGQHKHGTFYQVFHGKAAAFEGKSGLRIPDFTDGTSNTILVVEAARDVPWTKPEDIPFDPTKDVPKLGGHFPNGFSAAFADGSVRFLQSGINKDTLKALVTRNGGEVVGGF
jgi:hypothetical protein